MSFPLHRVILPGEGHGDRDLYVRGLEGAEVTRAMPLPLQSGQGFATDTYFGVFPHKQWLRLAELDDIDLVVEAEGALDITLKTLARARGADTIVATWAIEGTPGGAPWRAPVAQLLRTAPDEGVHVELRALSPAHVSAIRFETSQAPRRPVGLGLIITTFKRVSAVTAAVARLSDFRAHDPEKALGPLSIIVVDNGREIDPATIAADVVLPNPNVGGAGGFARGLSYLIDETDLTHGCFMDDDAATEAECVLRARRLLAFAVNDRVAVNAAMLRAEATFMMHEQGALFEWNRNFRIISRKNGLDLRQRQSIHEMLRPEPYRYGGFWFLAFPARGPLRFPYPLFVRGDDWLFSYLNDFQIEVMPGIASWQEGFEGKISPIEQYLAFKAFLIAELMLREPPDRTRSVKFFFRWIKRNLAGYCYDRAHMNCEALADVLKGPQFWAENVSLEKRIGTLKTQIRAEMPKVVESEPARPLERGGRREKGAARLLRALTFDGHLLPSAVLRRRGRDGARLHLLWAPSPEEVMRRRSVVYVDPESKRAFTATRDIARYFSILARTFVLLARFWVGYSRLRAAYIEAVDVLCTQDWWKQRIGEIDGTPNTAAPGQPAERRPMDQTA